MPSSISGDQEDLHYIPRFILQWGFKKTSHHKREFPNAFWSKNTLRLQSRQRLFTIVALNSTTSGGHSPEKKKDETTSKAATQGPPLLTVLAGFVVFFLICWIFGSIIMWLISLIVIPPTSK
ncbi:hypothetical protein HS088_TW01G00610 [Tripterygium wilfordii]|uniref:Uncharacterized protein n=1 Tax=Tripterygium wilfordii TaxID=458696 RepID=A0A7J7E2K9_TRIWF|nr:uncharacterized protein LOC120000288 isoform X2 [Tripterygium wilfordii]KAF5752694.1 hypothetical protein HS088_TW01G00610 [Tripterygium wilfordii]